MEPRITIAAIGSRAHREMIALRHRVLRAPLGLAFTPAQLAAEHHQVHLALWRNRRVVGTTLLVPPDDSGTARLRQMAVDPAFAGRGLGRALLRRAEAELAGWGTVRIVLSARQTARGFYERFGYVAQGDAFTEVTIPHVQMVKLLSPVRGRASPGSGQGCHGSRDHTTNDMHGRTDQMTDDVGVEHVALHSTKPAKGSRSSRWRLRSASSRKSDGISA